MYLKPRIKVLILQQSGDFGAPTSLEAFLGNNMFRNASFFPLYSHRPTDLGKISKILPK